MRLGKLSEDFLTKILRISNIINKSFEYTKRISKWQSKMDNLETLTTSRRQTKQKTHHNMCWTPLYANTYK